jgi:hypothetical protein
LITCIIRKLTVLITIQSIVVIGILACSCSNNSETKGTLAQSKVSDTNQSAVSTSQTKISSLLQLQISLRKDQMTSPTSERLDQMQEQGLNIKQIGTQRIYIYLKQKMTQFQVDELKSMDIILYLDSWIPPVGNNPTGFYLADMPVGKLDILAAKDYIIKLDTAEIQSQPQSDIPSGNMN